MRAILGAHDLGRMPLEARAVLGVPHLRASFTSRR
jgi:hypothetical protein